MEPLTARGSAEDRADVADHVVRLARAQDRKDWDAVAAAYTTDAVYEHPGGTLEGVDAIVERTRSALEDLDSCQHLLGSHTVEVDAEDAGTARSECYFHAQHVRLAASGGVHYVIAGTYADTLVRTPAGWRISRRVQTYSWRSGNRDVVAR